MSLALTYATEALRAIELWNMPLVFFDAIVLLVYTIGTVLLGSKILMSLMTR